MQSKKNIFTVSFPSHFKNDIFLKKKCFFNILREHTAQDTANTDLFAACSGKQQEKNAKPTIFMFSEKCRFQSLFVQWYPSKESIFCTLFSTFFRGPKVPGSEGMELPTIWLKLHQMSLQTVPSDIHMCAAQIVAHTSSQQIGSIQSVGRRCLGQVQSASMLSSKTPTCSQAMPKKMSKSA